MARIKFLWIAVVLLIGGCSTGIPIARYIDPPVGAKSFELCHGYSCGQKTATGFSDAQWGQIRSIFKHQPARSAEQERVYIARAIAQMERMAGAQTGTDGDDGEAHTIRQSLYQQDCIDETINTTHYLGFLKDDGLLRFHTPSKPIHRGFFLDGRWPHNTAAIREKATGQDYAVDSFYRSNGQEPYIIKRQDWFSGWTPNR
jgi:hypothetical protein